MKKTIALVICLVFMFSFICAKGIEFKVPEKVTVGEEFTVSVKLVDFAEGIYDIKIDVLSGTERIAKIFNNAAWQSTYYYMNDVINANQTKEFKLKIEKDFENANVTIKVKDSSEKTDIFTNYAIDKEANQQEQNIEEAQDNTTPEDKENSSEEQKTSSKVISQESLEKKEATLTTQITNSSANPIKLAPKSIKSKTSSGLNKETIAKWLLVPFCLLLVLLFLLNTKKRKNELRED